jgi:hypothetical protein
MSSMRKFPLLIAENLNRERIEIPGQLQGNFNILVVAFQQWQQTLVDTWIPVLESLRKQYPDFDYYEIPTIRKMNFIYRGFIDGGMRAGIKSTDTRARTITLYIDKVKFREDLGIDSEDTIYVFLVDRRGEILWRREGAIEEEKSQSLQSVLKKLRK